MTMSKHSKSPDVTKNNSFDVIYVKGNEVTDDSKRLRYESAGDVIQIEGRFAGAWQKTRLSVAPSSLLLGPDLGLSTAGAHFVTERADGSNKTLYPHMPINNDNLSGTSGNLINPILGEKLIRIPFVPDDRGEFIGTYFQEAPILSPGDTLVTKAYYKVGSVAATKPIRIRVWEGPDQSGPLVWDFNYSAGVWGPANTEIEIITGGWLEFQADTLYNILYTSDEPFSVITNIEVDSAWSYLDVYPIDHIDVLQDNMSISREASLTLDREANFVVGRYF